VRQYIITRVLSMAVVLFIVAVALFVVVRLLPGNVAYQILGETASSRDADEMRQQLGLDRPVLVQFGEWLGDAARLDLGESLIVRGLNVSDEIKRRIPVTLELAGLAMLFALLIATPIGIISAIMQDSWVDYVCRVFAISGLALPSFFVMTLAIVLPARWWGYLPPFGYKSFTEDPVANLQQFVVPALVLGFSLSASLMRIIRSGMLEVLRQDYVRTARAKGLGERAVIGRHALRNVMIPVITVIGLQLGNLLGGAVLIESVAGLPGLGRLLAESITRRDYTVVQGVVLVTSFTVVAINLLVDIAYGYLDPRIRYG